MTRMLKRIVRNLNYRTKLVPKFRTLPVGNILESSHNFSISAPNTTTTTTPATTTTSTAPTTTSTSTSSGTTTTTVKPNRRRRQSSSLRDTLASVSPLLLNMSDPTGLFSNMKSFHSNLQENCFFPQQSSASTSRSIC